jgi:hypothetical protein
MCCSDQCENEQWYPAVIMPMKICKLCNKGAIVHRKWRPLFTRHQYFTDSLRHPPINYKMRRMPSFYRSIRTSETTYGMANSNEQSDTPIQLSPYRQIVGSFTFVVRTYLTWSGSMSKLWRRCHLLQIFPTIFLSLARGICHHFSIRLSSR